MALIYISPMTDDAEYHFICCLATWVLFLCREQAWGEAPHAPVVWFGFPTGTQFGGLQCFLQACPGVGQQEKRKGWSMKAVSDQTSIMELYSSL